MPADGWKRGQYVRLAARYAIACLLLVGVFLAVPLGQAWQALSIASLPAIALALLLLSASRWVGAVRTRTLLNRQGVHFSPGQLFELSCVSTMYGLALPGSLSGGIVRWYRIGRPLSNYSTTTAALVFERLVGFATLAILGLVGWLLHADATTTSAFGWILALVLLFVLLLGALSLSQASIRIASWFDSLPLGSGRATERIRSVVIRTLEAASRYRDPRTLALTVMLSVGVNIIATAGFFFLASALSLELSFAALLWIRACTILITAVPLTPAGLGVREVVSVVLLGMVGVAATSAVAFSMLQFVVILFFAVLGGIFESSRYLFGTDSGSLNGGERKEQDVTKSDASRQHPVALIVLNHERKDLLLECLVAATATLYSPCRIVVVDNGSTDGSADAAERAFPEVTVLRNSDNEGVAGGRNVGARWVLENLDAYYLIFIDNDTLLEPDSVGEMVRRATEDSAIGLVAPKAFRSKGDKHLLSAGGLRFNPYSGVLNDVASGELDDGRFDQPRYVQACPGFAFLVHRDVFAQVGFFDEHFNPYGWEDADFSLRAGYCGYKIAYAPRAVVYHLGGRAGRGAVIGYEYHKARSMFYFVRRHTNVLQWTCFCLLLPIRSIVRIGRELSNRRFDIVRVWMSSLRQSTQRKDE